MSSETTFIIIFSIVLVVILAIAFGAMYYSYKIYKRNIKEYSEDQDNDTDKKLDKK